jgi:hypothetical protein
MKVVELNFRKRSDEDSYSHESSWKWMILDDRNGTSTCNNGREKKLPTAFSKKNPDDLNKKDKSAI